MPMSPAEIERRREYLSERGTLAALEVDSSRSFDKTLLAFSSGAVALSVTFIEKFPIHACIRFLFVSWFLWLLSILFQLISYRISSKGLRREIMILNKSYRNNEEEMEENKLSGWPTKLGGYSLTAFFLGSVCFLIYVATNLI